MVLHCTQSFFMIFLCNSFDSYLTCPIVNLSMCVLIMKVSENMHLLITVFVISMKMENKNNHLIW